MCDLAGSGSRIVRKEKKISIEKYFDESEWVDLKKKKKKKKDVHQDQKNICAAATSLNKWEIFVKCDLCIYQVEQEDWFVKGETNAPSYNIVSFERIDPFKSSMRDRLSKRAVIYQQYTFNHVTQSIQRYTSEALHLSVVNGSHEYREDEVMDESAIS